MMFVMDFALAFLAVKKAASSSTQRVEDLQQKFCKDKLDLPSAASGQALLQSKTFHSKSPKKPHFLLNSHSENEVKLKVKPRFITYNFVEMHK
jgi:hypothetical protein